MRVSGKVFSALLPAARVLASIMFMPPPAAIAAATKQHARIRTSRRDAEERQSVAGGEQAQKQKRPRRLHLFG